MPYEYRFIVDNKPYTYARHLPNDAIAVEWAGKTCRAWNPGEKRFKPAAWWVITYGDRVVSMS